MLIKRFGTPSEFGCGKPPARGGRECAKTVYTLNSLIGVDTSRSLFFATPVLSPVAGFDAGLALDGAVIEVHPRIDLGLQEPYHPAKVQGILRVKGVVALVAVEQAEDRKIPDLEQVPNDRSFAGHQPGYSPRSYIWPGIRQLPRSRRALPTSGASGRAKPSRSEP